MMRRIHINFLRFLAATAKKIYFPKKETIYLQTTKIERKQQ